MIMSQEQTFLKCQLHLQSMTAFLEQAAADQLRLDEVERDLFALLLQLGQTLLEAFVEAAGEGDHGETLTTPDGGTLQRLPLPHQRPYRSLFGELTIRRFVYGSSEGHKIEQVPLDAQLGLPAGEFSYVLEEWAQKLCVQNAFAPAQQFLDEMLGVKPSVRSLEHMNQTMAEFAANFAYQQPAPPADEEGELLVLTGDGKGVPMRREAAATSGRRKKGEKTPKQMAYVGAVYTIDRFVRTPEQVLEELARREQAAQRPAPCHKRVRAQMTYECDGEIYNGRVNLFGWLAEQRQQRDPEFAKVTVCVLDGEPALWQAYETFAGDAVGILDIFHVSEKLWQAAYCFHAEGSVAARDFVRRHLRSLLTGQADRVINGLRQQSRRAGLRGQKKKTVAGVAGYLRRQRAHLHYDEYLAAGYPIGSGVAEGACRHLVKDRLEGTGMRWKLAGAQAMLELRAVYLNNDWAGFVDYRIATEQERLYGKQDAEPNYTLAT